MIKYMSMKFWDLMARYYDFELKEFTQLPILLTLIYTNFRMSVKCRQTSETRRHCCGLHAEKVVLILYITLPKKVHAKRFGSS